MGLRSGSFNLSMLGCLFLIVSCDLVKTPKSNIEISFTQDTLNVGYTYWWPQSGPFIGDCGEELSLVFSGIVTYLGEPTDAAGPLYTSKKGVISIEKMLKIKTLEHNSYANQKFFSSDCFYGLDISVGDTVLVVCYDYEGRYSIPGGKSIIEVSSVEDPLIKSVKKYIDSKQNPKKIMGDSIVWASVQLMADLKQLVNCNAQSTTDTP